MWLYSLTYLDHKMGVLCGKWCRIKLDKIPEKNGEVAVSLGEVKCKKREQDFADFRVCKENSLAPPKTERSFNVFLQQLFYLKGKQEEPTVCHRKAGHLHYNLAPEPGSRETNAPHLMFLRGFYSNCLVDHPYKQLQMLNARRRSHMLSLWHDVWAAQK